LIESRSTESITITFPPLDGNALKQFFKIVMQCSSFQLCKTDCKTNFHQWHDYHEPTIKIIWTTTIWIRRRKTNVVIMRLQFKFNIFGEYIRLGKE
jgi:hypothetical protein